MKLAMLSIVASVYPKSTLVAGVLSHASLRFCSTVSKSSIVYDAPTINSFLKDKEKLKFIDVRMPEVYSKGHIPDAVNVHEVFTYLYESTNDRYGDRKGFTATFEKIFQDAGINGDELVIMYEDNLKTMYGASCRGLYLLKLLGHKNVAILNGGLDAWNMHGLPTSTVTPTTTQGSFRAQWVESMWGDKADVEMAIECKNAVLLDVRNTEEWKGISSLPYGFNVPDLATREGRLPGAIHIHWLDFMKTSKNGITYFREPAEVREICNAKGLTSESKVICYCLAGVRASNTFIALKEAGFKNVSMYLGSWYEWSRDKHMKIDSTKLD